MNKDNRNGCGFVGLCSALTVPFIILKLDGVVDWPWLWVLAPFWLPMAILTLILLLSIKYL